MSMDCNELALQIIVYLVFEYQRGFIFYNYSDRIVIFFVCLFFPLISLYCLQQFIIDFAPDKEYDALFIHHKAYICSLGLTLI